MVWYRYLICIMSHFLAYPVPDTHHSCEKKRRNPIHKPRNNATEHFKLKEVST